MEAVEMPLVQPLPVTTRDDIVSAARRWLATPYHHQASRRGVGADCLGLVRGVYRELMGTEPEEAPGYSPDWGEAGGHECLLEAAARNLIRGNCKRVTAGDVIIFRIRRSAIAKHTAIATSDETMIHAVEKAGTVEVPISAWWQRRIVAVFTFPIAND